MQRVNQKQTWQLAGLLLVAASMLLAFTLRAAVAFEPVEINQDERYYLSAASTSADGRALMPFIMGFEDVPIFAGNGYAVYVYTAAYQVLGPSIVSLRIVAFLFGLLTLPAIYLTLRRLYGHTTGLVGLAIFPWTFFFIWSNSARFDAPAIAFVAWVTWLVVESQYRERGTRYALVAGVLMGFGLQVHLNTTAVACAFGVLFLVNALTHYRRDRQFRAAVLPLALYVGGYAIAAPNFIIFNILPDPEAFFNTIGNTRLLDNDLFEAQVADSERVDSVLYTLLNPEFLIQREWGRYTGLFGVMPVAEMLLTLVAFPLLIWRRMKADRIVLLMNLGGILAAAIILNKSYLYLAHLLPILFLPLPAAITYVWNRIEQPRMIAAGLAVAAALILARWDYMAVAFDWQQIDDEPAPVFIDIVHDVVPQDAVVAGDAIYYIEHFADYSHYLGLGGMEQNIGKLIYDVPDAVSYWHIKQPEYLFGFITDAEVQAYISQSDYIAIAPYVLARSDLWYEPPDFDAPLAAFDDVLLLLNAAVSAESPAACETITVMTWWQVQDDAPAPEYSASLRLLDDGGNLIAQADGPPSGRTFDTWAPFEYRPDLRDLTLPCDLPPGDYTLAASVYHFSTLETLPVDGDLALVERLTVGP